MGKAKDGDEIMSTILTASRASSTWSLCVCSLSFAYAAASCSKLSNKGNGLTTQLTVTAKAYELEARFYATIEEEEEGEAAGQRGGTGAHRHSCGEHTQGKR